MFCHCDSFISVKVNTIHQHLGHSSNLQLQFEPLFEACSTSVILLTVTDQRYQMTSKVDILWYQLQPPTTEMTLIEKSVTQERHRRTQVRQLTWNIIFSCANTQCRWYVLMSAIHSLTTVKLWLLGYSYNLKGRCSTVCKSWSLILGFTHTLMCVSTVYSVLPPSPVTKISQACYLGGKLISRDSIVEQRRVADKDNWHL